MLLVALSVVLGFSTSIQAEGKTIKVTPKKGIQAALDKAEPGDVIVLAPGTYYENPIVRRGGQPGKPLTIRAQKPGTVVISGADQDLVKKPLKFEPFGDEKDGIYQARIARPVKWMMIDGRVQYPYPSVDSMKQGKDVEGAFERRLYMPNAKAKGKSVWLGGEGFFWQDGVLYVKHCPPARQDGYDLYEREMKVPAAIQAPKDPNKCKVEILREAKLDINFEPFPADSADPYKGSLLFSFGLAVKASHVTIEGIQFYMSGNVAILVCDPAMPKEATAETLKDAAFSGKLVNNLTVRDCQFAGARLGLNAQHGFMLGRDLLVEHCEYACIPSYGENFSTFINTSCDNAVLRHNLVASASTAFQLRAPLDEKPLRRIEVHHNLLYGIDNRLGTFMNTSLDRSACFDLKPSAALSLRIHHNVMLYNTLMFDIRDTKCTGLMFDHNVVWQNDFGFNPDTGKQYYGATIVHNTLVNTLPRRHRNGYGRALLRLPFFVEYNRATWYKEWLFANNILFWSPRARPHDNKAAPWIVMGMVPDERNLYCNLPPSKIAAEFLTTHKLKSLVVMDPLFVSQEPADLRLRPESPGVDAGGHGKDVVKDYYRRHEYFGKLGGAKPEDLRRASPDFPPTAGKQAGEGENDFFHKTAGKAPDIGAFERGVEWVFPQPGPRWADADGKNVYPKRVPFPTDFNMALAGFGKLTPDSEIKTAKVETKAPAGTVKITNVKVGKGPAAGESYVSFDIAWDGSWRREWKESPKKVIEGGPTSLENWDAAWVFLKFRARDAAAWSHATLAADAAAHKLPAGAALSLGLTDGKAVGAFIYRGKAGRGTISCKNVKLLWRSGADKAIPAKVEVQPFAIEMVYIPEGAFGAGSPGGFPPAIISNGKATEEGGFVAVRGSRHRPAHDDFPNGFGAFYCMKRKITQGQYADFLNTLAPEDAKERFVEMSANGYTITRKDGRYLAGAPDRMGNYISWRDGRAFAAWAGLRPMTDLEFVKASRGPIKDGLVGTVGLGHTANGASYWGVRELSEGFWERVESSWRCHYLGWTRSLYTGKHGDGTLVAPVDWSGIYPFIRGGVWGGVQDGSQDRNKAFAAFFPALHVDTDQHFVAFWSPAADHGWRGVRTAQ